jgi:uncharacterized protein YndB with AHSA1/START domain
MRMKLRHIHVTAETSAPLDEVYRLLADGSTWPQWSPIESFELERPGTDGPEGVGAIRIFRLGRTTGRDQLLALVPNRRIEYASLSGLPVRDYVGEVDLEPAAGGGTTIHWRSSFYPARRGTGWIVERAIRRFLDGCTDGLAAYTTAPKAADVV